MSKRNLLFNYIYQIKKSVKLGKFNFSILRYSLSYFKLNCNSNFSHLKMELPWITFEAFDFLNSILTRNFVVYEFGSGGSSLFFAKRVKEIYSVEHDDSWFSQFQSELKDSQKKFENLHLRLVLPTIKNDYTEAISLSEKRFSSFDFEDYVKSILDFPDNFFDLIVIDGRARPFCLKNAIPKLKTGGYLLFDNSDRIHYQNELKKISTWKELESFGPVIGDLSFGQTSIYKKPII